MASGDFNGDTYPDVAVGVPNEGIGTVNGAGMVNIIYGSPSGLANGGNQVLHQDRPPEIRGAPEPSDHFGAPLIATGSL